MVDLEALLLAFRRGELSLETAIARLRGSEFRDLGRAKIDHGRHIRCGAPEVIFCPGKSLHDLRAITREILDRSPWLLATRAEPEQVATILEVAPDARYEETARTVSVLREPVLKSPGRIALLAAGTSDLRVAEEARITAEFLGHEVETVYDVGVAGLHRLFAHLGTLERAHVVIVVAGMEGALASVVAGLTAKPVLGVPTSIGYGASFGGVAALLAMLNSCAARVAVCNIDNGFGAASVASSILKTCFAERDAPPGACRERSALGGD